MEPGIAVSNQKASIRMQEIFVRQLPHWQPVENNNRPSANQEGSHPKASIIRSCTAAGRFSARYTVWKACSLNSNSPDSFRRI